MKRIAMMYKLDWRGRVIDTRHVVYHSTEWMNSCSLGFITAEIYEVSL
jgi:hypothetical protein